MDLGLCSALLAPCRNRHQLLVALLALAKLVALALLALHRREELLPAES